MNNHETWPPIRGTGWTNVGRRGVRQVQRRTGDAGVDSKIQDLIEDAATSPDKAAEYIRQAWELHDAHGSTRKRLVREVRMVLSSTVYLVLWLVIGAVLVIISAHIWG
ncbi:hypothetical protein G7043_31330 [Lentzea sp. NEAU-D13]|uniref:Uncharacterized protein n=1 Tax=Lentzea alba TaxID=2714351 RepID=A0A7C9RU31_9PSEU|nr:hypothetical protein [Lentzea alba]NGY63425.1 hypothetical protein [Lentzea alba]